MEVIIGKGKLMDSLEMNITNENLTLNTWYTMEITQTAFIAAIPRSSANKIKFSYKFSETLDPSRTYELQLVANNI